MTRRASLSLALLLGAAFSLGSGPPLGKQDLDLPYSFRGSAEEEEAEDVIFFLGAPYRGRGFIFVGAGTS